MYTGALKASFIITGSLSAKKELAGTQVPLNHLLMETPFHLLEDGCLLFPVSSSKLFMLPGNFYVIYRLS